MTIALIVWLVGWAIVFGIEAWGECRWRKVPIYEPGGGATFDDAPLREFLDWFNKHKPSWMPQAAISELCRRALAGRTQP